MDAYGGADRMPEEKLTRDAACRRKYQNFSGELEVDLLIRPEPE
jgi:hypothetical protein